MIYLTAATILACLTLAAVALVLCFRHLTDLQAAIAVERATFATERADLLQRIQAPAEAVIQHSVAQPFPSPEAKNLEDDTAFAPDVTKEQLADLLDAAERGYA